MPLISSKLSITFPLFALVNVGLCVWVGPLIPPLSKTKKIRGQDTVAVLQACYSSLLSITVSFGLIYVQQRTEFKSARKDREWYAI